MHKAGYKTFRIGNYRLQVYYPAFILAKDDLLITLSISVRFCWKDDYKAVALSIGVFGLGLDYDPNYTKDLRLFLP